MAVSALVLSGSIPAPVDVFGSPSPGSHSELLAFEWRDGPPLIVPRASPAVVSLPNGNVLVIGGVTSTGPTATTEVFDVASAAWKLGPTMSVKRVGHTATLLKDGTVLVVGGDTGTGATASAEILNTSSNGASVVPSMTFARSGHGAVLLGNGMVLVTGGSDWVRGTWKQAEVFDRATLKWLPAGSMSTSRIFFSLHLLVDGTALAIGGDVNGTSERYNSTSNSWGNVSKMSSPRYQFGSALVSGKVLVAGGLITDSPLNTSELFDPSTDSWRTVGNMSAARAKFAVEPLPNGDFIAAGSSSKSGTTKSSEVFHPETSTWQATASMNVSRGAYGASVLPDNGVLVIGGNSGSAITSSVETYSRSQYKPQRPCKPIDLVPLVEAATELPGNSSRGMIAKLVAAQAQYDSANFSVCLNIMHAFYNQLRAFAHNGHMNEENADAIYEGYVSVVQCIGGEPLEPVTEIAIIRIASIAEMV